jgi:phage terminase large subunit-like protein
MSAAVPVRAKTKRRKPAATALLPAKPARVAPDPRWKLSPAQKLNYLKHEVPRKDWGLPSGRVILFAHMLTVPAGRLIGKPLRLREFQLGFIRDIYNPRTAHGLRKRRQAIMSVGRRAGKTLLAALLVLVHLVGPEARRNSVITSAATTRKQAGIVYRLCAQMTRASPILRSRLKLIESTKSIVRVEDLSSYHALSAEAGGAFGEGIDFCVYDELAQASSTALYDALQTSLGSQVEPLMVIISTQAPSNSHILSELIDYGLKVKAGEFEDDSFAVHLYAADDGCDLMDRSQWKKANPTLGDYRSLEEFESTMRRASMVPSLEASVRNLYLNTRTQSVAPFLTANTWAHGDAPIDESLFYSGRPVFAGLDLSARTDLCAFVLAVMDDDGVIHLMPRIFTPDDTLDDRALVDRAPYRVWADRHFLIPVPGTAIDYDFVAQDVGELAGKMPLQRMAYDRWRIDVFKLSLQRLGITVELVPFGQGFKDMAPAVDTFEEMALSGKLRHGQHPVLRWAVSNSVIDRDPAGNRKLTKSRSFGRIDPAVAAIMAVAAMKLQTTEIVDVATLVF